MTSGTQALTPEDVYVFPTSFAQRRIWFVERLLEGSPVHNLPVALRLTGRLDLDALRWALGALVRRHESLRTQFADVDGEPMQAISAELDAPLDVVDLSTVPAGARVPAALERVTARQATPFDLSRAPLFSATVYVLGEADHIFSLVTHHIVTDGWSMGVLVRDLVELYAARCTGTAPALPELQVQYADFAHWQRQWLRGETLENLLAYWRTELEGVPPALDLLTDWPRPAVQSTAGAEHRISLPPALTRGLRALARAEGTTLYVTLLAGFAILLHHHSRQDDLVVGSPIANRHRAEVEPLIGFFVNTLALRTRVDPRAPLREVVRRVARTAIDAYAHQDLPFELLVEELRPGRGLGRTPLFQVMFEFGNTPMPPLEAPGLELVQVTLDRPLVEFDLTLSLMEDGDALTGALEYCTDLFAPGTIARLARHYERVLEALVAAPGTPVRELCLLDGQERGQLATWGRWQPEDPSAVDVLALLEAAEQRWTDRVAVRGPGVHLTYGALRDRAGRWARALRRAGAGPGTLVGVFLDRSPDLAVALRAALGSGAAFLPLDPAEPPARLERILSDARPAVILTVEGLAGALPTGPWRTLCLDRGAPDDGGAPPPVGGPPETPAYVVYTSGSTGEPRGVLVSRGAAAAYVTGFVERLGLDPRDRFLAFASVGFDVMVEETLPTWSAGGTVVFGRERLFPAYQELAETLAVEAVTTVELPTPYWHEWVRDLEESGQAPPRTLRRVVIGGDRVSPERLSAWRRFGTALVHVFGLTETTVTSTTYEDRPAGDEPAPDNLPVGSPLACARVHVLNDALVPVPAGAPGELYIGGPAVALGYLGDPALTAARYVADPFARTPGARLYRTGDLVRYGDDGQLRFLGRVDGQCRIRGFRVEVGEVEAALRKHPAVSDAVVTVVDDAFGGSLLAHVVPRDGAAPSVTTLRAFLQGLLPDHMVPARLETIATIPLTAHGKVDQRELRRRAVRAPAPAQPGTAPSGRLEEQIADLWRQVLGAEQVMADVNFFDVGGHSLLVARLQSRFRAELGRDVPIIEFFKHPTVAAQAAMLRGLDGEEGTRDDGVERANARRRAAGTVDRRQARQSVAVAGGTDDG